METGLLHSLLCITVSLRSSFYPSLPERKKDPFLPWIPLLISSASASLSLDIHFAPPASHFLSHSNSTIDMRTQLSFLLTLLFPFLALASPHPFPFPSPAPTSTGVPSATFTPPSSYYLRSRVVGSEGNQSGSDKDGLYVSCFGTGELFSRVFFLGWEG